MKSGCVLGSILVIIAAMQSSSSAAVQSTFYVSPTGAGDYSQSSPGSLSGIQAKVRTVNTTMTGDIVVYLKGGVYTLTAPMNFGPSDGGSGTNIVAYRNAPGEKPTISGGKQVTGWSVHSGNIWKASVPGVNRKIRNVFVNGVRADMARGPNVWGQGGWGTGAYAKTVDGIQFTPSQVAPYNNPSLIELRQVVNWKFSENTFCVREIALNQGGYTVFKMQQPYWSLAQVQELCVIPEMTENQKCDWPSRPGPKVCGTTLTWWESNEGFDFYNAYEFLDVAGEFYFDVPASILYYIPRAGENLASADVQVALVEGLVNIKGTNLTTRVKNLQFWGTTFEYSDWMMVNMDGSYGCASGGIGGAVAVRPGKLATCWGDMFQFLYGDLRGSPYTPYPALINIESADNIDLQWNVIKHTGANGITLKNDAVNCNIVGNVIYDVGACGISIGHPGDCYIGDSSATYPQEYGPSREGTCTNIKVRNNLIHDVGAQFRGCDGVVSLNTDGVDVSHNQVYNCPYTAIGMGWGFDWGGTLTKNNKVDSNRIYNFLVTPKPELRCLSDGGGIYMPGPAVTNCQAVGNYIRTVDFQDDSTLRCFIYLDSKTCGWTVKDNVCFTSHYVAEDYGAWCGANAEENYCGPNFISNNGMSNKPIEDSAGLQACYKLIGTEPIAPLPSDVTCATTGIFERAALAPAALKPAVTKMLVFDLRGRLIANYDHPSIRTSMLHSPARFMSTGIVVVKTEFAAGSAKRSVLAVAR